MSVRVKVKKNDILLRLLEVATSPLLHEPDWKTNLQIIDKVNATRKEERHRLLVKAIRKNLSHKAICVVMNTLMLMEALMKNCSTEFQLAMANSKLVAAMVKLVKAGKKGGLDEKKKQEKCLELIQSWGEAFLTRQQVGRIFVETYHELRKKGKYQFPPQNMQNCLNSLAAKVSVNAKNPDWEASGDKVDVVRLHSLVREAQTLLHSGANHDVPAVEKVIKSVHSAKLEVEKAISTNKEEHQLEVLIQLNDKLQSVLSMHNGEAKPNSDTRTGELPTSEHTDTITGLQTVKQADEAEDLLTGNSTIHTQAAFRIALQPIPHHEKLDITTAFSSQKHPPMQPGHFEYQTMNNQHKSGYLPQRESCFQGQQQWQPPLQLLPPDMPLPVSAPLPTSEPQLLDPFASPFPDTHNPSPPNPFDVSFNGR